MAINKFTDIILVLVDESYKTDYRVLLSMKKYKNPIIINCNELELKNKINFLNISKNLFLTIFTTIHYWKLLYKHHKLQPKGFFSGLKRSIILSYRSELIAKQIMQKHPNIYLIYANDMLCGLVGLKIKKCLNSSLIYDAHEVEFHRNRKNGLMRVVLDIILEKRVIRSADSIIVVNQPIKDLYVKLYKIESSKISIVNNNFFSPFFQYALKHFSNDQQFGIVYVGAGIKGRMLDRLTDEASRTDINLYGFFLGDIPVCAKGEHWKIGSKDYLDELLSLVKGKRLAMWCCTEDVCLSYRLSLPNKFFQAIAIGIPVVVTKGTYLADLVEEYNVGYIYDTTNFDDIVEKMKDSIGFDLILKNVADFQVKIYQEGLIL